MTDPVPRLIHVFLGTKAQYIKAAPLLRLMDERSVPYRLIDSGQHGQFSRELRGHLGVREPDHHLGSGKDVVSIPGAIRWAAGVATRGVRKTALRREVFAGHGGICVVHGDTPSTLLAALLARRAGIAVAHMEAGLRSYDVLNPFPEELIRLGVMRLSALLFAPDETAAAALHAMRVQGDVVRTGGNTSIEAVKFALEASSGEGAGHVLMTMHRVENLNSSNRIQGFVDLAHRLAERHHVHLVLHRPTTHALERIGALKTLQLSGVNLHDLLPHAVFLKLVAGADFVVTDGGSIQEECAHLGVPTLLWREATERPDGLGENIVLSRYSSESVDDFIANASSYRRPPRSLDTTPSEVILNTLLEWLAESGPDS